MDEIELKCLRKRRERGSMRRGEVCKRALAAS